MIIKISDIVVGERFRKKFEDIDELSKSIDRYGLIEPIIIDEHNNLIAGERRLKAHIMLKRDSIEAKRMEDLSDLEKKEIELEENIQRKAFTWQEEVAAKEELHKLKQKIYGKAVQKKGDNKGKWGIIQTAEALGESSTVVSQDIQLSEGIRAFPELLKEKNKSVAFKKLKQLKEKIVLQELQKRVRGLKEITHPNVILGDCVNELIKMESDSVDLILTDPPYGIDIGEAATYKENAVNVYTVSDDEHSIYDMLDKAIKEMYRVLKNDRHMFIFHSITHYQRMLSMLMKHGLWVNPIPIIWDKGSGSYASQGITFTSSYECFFHCKKGNRKLNGTPRNVYNIKRVPSDQRVHPTQRPTELLRNMIELSTMPAELVLDPFAGSGSTLIAAMETQRRSIGIELNPSYHKVICEQLKEMEL